MVREAAINLYLAITGLIFNICRVFPVQKKTVMIASFGDNIQYVLDEVHARTSSKIVLLKDSKCNYTFRNADDKNTIRFIPVNIPGTIRGIYHLATAEHVFVDNYQVVLASCDFKKETTCVQLWHADGAVKLFGFKDKATTERTASAQKRFKQVYSKFHKVVVSSDDMGWIFEEAFDLGDENLLKTGMPRTDFFFNEAKMDRAMDKLHRQMPQLKDKQVILYAPTFREGHLKVDEIRLNIKNLENSLSEDYHLLLRLHPAVKFDGKWDSEFVTDVSQGQDIFELLAVTDILVTDYSSIPFEFSILGKPMIFYPYDLEEYKDTRGIWFDYETFVPGPVVYSSTEMIDIIKTEEYRLEKVLLFDETWNKYADGRATEKLVSTLYKDAAGR
ncbi:CDP-glycerol glycerophosphotransferase family protein [Salinicoccus sp. HZC-1]|uniref:CDP-glycerol glycerophosphotransferase family protein n=1 Tax=Salinicoccus sp. HZC-1 TaxID=3385497 RepID=UPI00398AFF75